MESKTYQYRKITKPLLERKRRARINKCLDNLKDLMIDNLRQQGDNNLRLEKADILELTVEHLKKLKNNISGDTTSTNSVDSFRSGYIHAANEVSHALSKFSRIDIQMGTKLMTHLGHRLNEIQQQQQETIFVKRNISIPSKSKELPGLSLNVYCDTNDFYEKPTMISPSLSSGYGSDCEFSYLSQSPSSAQNQQIKINDNVWRPW